MKIGTIVECTLKVDGHGDSHSYFVIGEMEYSTGDHFCIAREGVLGMPINKNWLMAVGGFNSKEAIRLRKIYLDRFPGTFCE